MPWTWQTSTLVSFHAYVTTQNLSAPENFTLEWIGAQENGYTMDSELVQTSDIIRGSGCVVARRHATFRGGDMALGVVIGTLAPRSVADNSKLL